VEELGPIDRYLAASGLQARELAARAQLDEGYLSGIRHGTRRLGAVVALRLVEASGGELTLDELLRWRCRRGRAA